MAKIPGGFSPQAFAIESAIHEGRDRDAQKLIYAALSTGKADEKTQKIAASYFQPKVRKRGRPKAAPAHWFEIGTEFHSLRGRLVKYEDALRNCSTQFNRSESSIRAAIKYYDAHDGAAVEATAE